MENTKYRVSKRSSHQASIRPHHGSITQELCGLRFARPVTVGGDWCGCDQDLLSINVPAPPPPPKPRRRPPPANQPQDKDGQVKCPLRPYKGDVFGNYQYEGGLLYLSRFDLGKSNKKRGQGA